jgi:hypothetical protein
MHCIVTYLVSSGYQSGEMSTYKSHPAYESLLYRFSPCSLPYRTTIWTNEAESAQTVENIAAQPTLSA